MVSFVFTAGQYGRGREVGGGKGLGGGPSQRRREAVSVGSGPAERTGTYPLPTISSEARLGRFAVPVRQPPLRAVMGQKISDPARPGEPWTRTHGRITDFSEPEGIGGD